MRTAYCKINWPNISDQSVQVAQPTIIASHGDFPLDGLQVVRRSDHLAAELSVVSSTVKIVDDAFVVASGSQGGEVLCSYPCDGNALLEIPAAIGSIEQLGVLVILP